VAQLSPQALGACFSLLLQHAQAMVGLFFTPSNRTGLDKISHLKTV